MKYGELSNNTSHNFMFFESIHDVLEFESVFSKDRNDSLWLTYLRSGKMNLDNMFNYLAHSTTSCIPEERMVSYHMKCISEVNGINGAADIIYQATTGVIKSMIKYINLGYVLRVNQVGGFYPIKNYDEYTNISDLTFNDMKKYVIDGDFDSTVFILTKENVFIENGFDSDSFDFVNEMNAKYNFGDNYQIVDKFDKRTIKYTKDNFIQLISEGLKNGLKRIFIQTTGTNIPQMELLESFKPIFVSNNIELIIKKI